MSLNPLIEGKKIKGPWLVWLSGLSAGLQTKGWPDLFPVLAHAWAAGQVPSGGHVRVNHRLMFLCLSFSLPSSLSKNKERKSFLKIKAIMTCLNIPITNLPIFANIYIFRKH